MANGDNLLGRSVKVHPVFLVGVAVLLVAIGAVFAETLFPLIAGAMGASVLVSAGVWIVLSVVTIILGLWRSFEVIGDAE